MPSLGQKVFGYISRQLSFIAEPREEVKPNSSCFVTKYLESSGAQLASINNGNSPPNKVFSGKVSSDLPVFTLAEYDADMDTIRTAITGPGEGLTYVRRLQLNLQTSADIDFIDDRDEEVRQNPIIKSKYSQYGRKMSTTSRKSIDPPVSIVTTKADDDINKNTEHETNDLIANVTHWNMPPGVDHAFGNAISLYEKNPITNEHAGSPIADCYGMVARKNSCIMALGDGVNWGEKARIASCAAVQASIEYLTRSLFAQGSTAKTTREVFDCLLESIRESQEFILEVNGHLTTLTVCVILPVESDDNDIDVGDDKEKFVVCACNVGDSLGYVYGKNGVREFTLASHDIMNNRDMRDALGALGPVDGNKPELSNLTLSMTIVEKGDIVYLTSDGISDNFDPVVGKFASAEPETDSSSSSAPTSTFDPPKKQELAPKRQNKSTSSLYPKRTQAPPPSSSSSAAAKTVSFPFQEVPSRGSGGVQMRQKKSNLTPSSIAISSPMPVVNHQLPIRPKYMRSKTHIEPRLKHLSPITRIRKSSAGLPIVTPMQRYNLTLLRMEDLFQYGINGTVRPCSNARKLCNLLIDFSRMITSAKRRILEQRELFWKMSYDSATGTRKEVELTRGQQRAARKRTVDQHFSQLPGKLDHATVVGWTVGSEEKSSASTIEDFEIVLNSRQTKALSLNPSSLYTETDF